VPSSAGAAASQHDARTQEATAKDREEILQDTLCGDLQRARPTVGRKTRMANAVMNLCKRPRNAYGETGRSARAPDVADLGEAVMARP
jgi:hypothetical protein